VPAVPKFANGLVSRTAETAVVRGTEFFNRLLTLGALGWGEGHCAGGRFAFAVADIAGPLLGVIVGGEGLELCSGIVDLELEAPKIAEHL